MKRNCRRLPFAFVIVMALSFSFFYGNCGGKDRNEVVVYTSLDQVHSEPIIKAFEQETGTRVKALYDLEATKTTGLVNRLIAEKDNPQADVFWNSEVGRTLALKQKGLLKPYRSPNAENIPDRFKDPEGYWTGFAARARVLIYNTQLVKPDEAPQSIFDLSLPKWKGEVALANPLFGTTATHAAALFALLGKEKAESYFNALKANRVAIVDGNSVVKEQVAAGEFKVGLTDTDDANGAILDGKPIRVVYPDPDGIGTLVIPNTVAMIANGPNPENAKRFIDYLLTEAVERKLSESRSAQMPVRTHVPKPESVPDVYGIRSMPVSFEEIAAHLEGSTTFLQEIFLR